MARRYPPYFPPWDDLPHSKDPAVVAENKAAYERVIASNTDAFNKSISDGFTTEPDEKGARGYMPPKGSWYEGAAEAAVRRGDLRKEASTGYFIDDSKHFDFSESNLKSYLGRASKDKPRTLALGNTKKHKASPKYSKMKSKLGVKGKTKPGALLSALNSKKKAKYL